MQISQAHLVWEVGDANTVRRGGGHCGQVRIATRLSHFQQLGKTMRVKPKVADLAAV
jgi:hypothetical protein